ncbi:MAG: tyrosine-type recombinase/integrase [Ktedonobacteraceae bacterium]|nr:tyrosine-type recombinase/integrase [Ktedonobacteraceae bacterium]
MLQDVVNEYITSLAAKEYGSNQNTIVAYRNDLNQLCVYLKQQEIDNWSLVTQEHLAGYLLEMREEQAYRPTTIARKFAACKSFFRYLHDTVGIAINPLDRLEAPRIQRYPPRVLTAEQIARLFLQVETETVVGQRDLAMLHMLLATGMRASELVSLDLEDFDAEHATVFCLGHNGRSRRKRLLPLHSLAVAVTQSYLENVRPHLIRHSEERALFLNHRGDRLTRQGFWLIIKGYARQTGIVSITPHMLRHACAVLMLKDGMELRSVQELLGHAHISSTQVYSQFMHTEVASSGNYSMPSNRCGADAQGN